jgi:hypothetical protein
MASEIRTSFDLSDIAGIEIECSQCFAKVLYPIKQSGRRVLANCTNCQTVIFPGHSIQRSVAAEQIKCAIDALNLLSAPDAEKFNANIRIQVKPIPK